MDPQRRQFLKRTAQGAGMLGGVALLGALPLGLRSVAVAAEGPFEFQLTEDQWRARLTPQQFAVLRQEATESAHSSPLDKEYGKGTYHCAGCDLPLYASDAKYDSGTGWPSFHSPLPDAVRTKTDWKLILPRTEVHCRRCGGHLGHVFDDGPPPSGKRYCMNGVALSFKPAS